MRRLLGEAVSIGLEAWDWTVVINTPSESPETGSSPLVNPSSSLLQGLLKEHRESRGSRATSAEPCDDSLNTPERSQPQEDTTSENMRKVNNALTAGLKQPREMGMREMDQVSFVHYGSRQQNLILYSTFRKSINRILT